MGWGTDNVPVDATQLTALRSNRRGQGTQHVMKMLRHMWVGWGWGGALITFLLMLRNSTVGCLLEDSQKIVVSSLRTRGKLDRRVDQRLLNQIKAFMYRHNSGNNLWKELGMLAKKSRRWTTCKGELKNDLCWMTGGTDNRCDWIWPTEEKNNIFSDVLKIDERSTRNAVLVAGPSGNTTWGFYYVFTRLCKYHDFVNEASWKIHELPWVANRAVVLLVFHVWNLCGYNWNV